jgi:hypothetical protein
LITLTLRENHSSSGSMVASSLRVTRKVMSSLTPRSASTVEMTVLPSRPVSTVHSSW